MQYFKNDMTCLLHSTQTTTICKSCVEDKIESIQKENKELRELLREALKDMKEMKDYLDNGHGTTINNYSGFHNQLSDFLNRPEVKALLEKDNV